MLYNSYISRISTIIPLICLDHTIIYLFLAALDISSDLTELGRTPVAVISAGIKSILDIPRTLEYLVPVYDLFSTLSLTLVLRCTINL